MHGDSEKYLKKYRVGNSWREEGSERPYSTRGAGGKNPRVGPGDAGEGVQVLLDGEHASTSER